MFVEGKDYEGTVSEIYDKGALVLLGEDIEAFAPKRHTEKEDGSYVVEGDVLFFRVLDFSKENKKILVSHTSIFKDNLKVEKKKKEVSTRKAIKKLEEDKQQSTLGDLDELSALKNDLEKDNN